MIITSFCKALYSIIWTTSCKYLSISTIYFKCIYFISCTNSTWCKWSISTIWIYRQAITRWIFYWFTSCITSPISPICMIYIAWITSFSVRSIENPISTPWYFIIFTLCMVLWSSPVCCIRTTIISCSIFYEKIIITSCYWMIDNRIIWICIYDCSWFSGI